MVAPTTQSIRLRWSPELRFYEQRIAILRSFEERAALQAFRIDDDTVSAQLADWRWLSVAPSGLTLNILTEVQQTDDGWADLKAVIDILRPRSFIRARASYQHVLELPLSFEAAVARGHDRLYRQLSTDEATLGDWALLADVDAVGPPRASGQIEFGIVRRDELPQRLSRSTGRSAGMLHIGQREWDVEAFKEVSLFADSDLVMRTEAGREDALLEDASRFWITSRAQMGRLVEELRSKLVSDDGGTD